MRSPIKLSLYGFALIAFDRQIIRQQEDWKLLKDIPLFKVVPFGYAEPRISLSEASPLMIFRCRSSTSFRNPPKAYVEPSNPTGP